MYSAGESVLVVYKLDPKDVPTAITYKATVLWHRGGTVRVCDGSGKKISVDESKVLPNREALAASMEKLAAPPELSESELDDGAIARRALLALSLDRLLVDLGNTTLGDPWGVLLDLRDFYGRQFDIWLERGKNDLSADDAERKVDDYVRDADANGRIPIISAAINREMLEAVIPNISPTGMQSVSRMEQGRTPTRIPVIVVAEGGNSYTWINPNTGMPELE
jgi:hypothetical protein